MKNDSEDFLDTLRNTWKELYIHGETVMNDYLGPRSHSVIATIDFNGSKI